MGLNASIIVYPMIEEARDGLLTRLFGGAADEADIRTFVRSSDQLQAMARRIVTAFERRGFISQGAAASAPVTQGHGASPTRIEFEAPRANCCGPTWLSTRERYCRRLTPLSTPPRKASGGVTCKRMIT